MTSQAPRYVDEAAYRHLTQGLTFDPDNCIGVVDHVLAGINAQTGLPDQLIAWIQAGAHESGPCPYDGLGRIIVDVEQLTNRDDETTYLATVRRAPQDPETAPLLMMRMHSPTLDIPMLVELPLRAVLRGNAPLPGSYTLYLHALLTNRGEAYVYYGITKRGWGLRFNEHARAAFAQKSKRLLASTLNDLVQARADALYGQADGRAQLGALTTSVCGVGMSREAALAAEERLVDKYSLTAKHPLGLNMIPGGAAGIAQARRFWRRPAT